MFLIWISGGTAKYAPWPSRKAVTSVGVEAALLEATDASDEWCREMATKADALGAYQQVSGWEGRFDIGEAMGMARNRCLIVRIGGNE